MKKLMALLSVFMLVIPFASVSAADKTWYTYTTGDEVNFYQYEGDSVGKTTIILSDEGQNSQYVKTLVVGFTTSNSQPYAEKVDGDPTVFENTLAYKNLKDAVNAELFGMPNAKDINVKGNLGLITLDELKTIFGATLSGDKYVISAEKWGHVFDIIAGSKSGMYTQTVEGEDVWVVKFTKDDNDKITAINVEKEPVASGVTWELVPVVYLDKTYDCTEREVQSDYACYQCNDDYVWSKVGSQAETCKLIEKINKKAECVKSPKTGLEDYIVEFLAVAGICGVALVVAKRKELFRGI